jgi:hypothetical protein
MIECHAGMQAVGGRRTPVRNPLILTGKEGGHIAPPFYMLQIARVRVVVACIY